MRRTRIALLVSVMMMGTTALQAQTAHTDSCCSGGAQACQQGCDSSGTCNGCGGCGGALSGLAAHLHSALSGVLPCGIGGDARHKIYKAALRRNTFDKKCLLPIPYLTHILPMYRHKRCCTAGTHSQCQTCGPQAGMGDEVIEMYEGLDAMPLEPTPAAAPARQIVPSAVIGPQAADQAPRAKRSRTARMVTRTRPRKATPQPAKRHSAQRTSADRVAQHRPTKVNSTPTLRTYAPVITGTEKRATKISVRQVSAVRQRTASDPANPLR